MKSATELMDNKMSVQLGMPLEEVKMEGGFAFLPIAAALGVAALPGISNIFKSAGSWIGRKIFGKGMQGTTMEGEGVVLIGDVRRPVRLPQGTTFGTGIDGDISLPMGWNSGTSFPYMRGAGTVKEEEVKQILDKINANREAVITYVRDNIDTFQDAKDLAIKIGKFLATL